MKVRNKYTLLIIVLIVIIGFVLMKTVYNNYVNNAKQQVSDIDLKNFDLKNQWAYYTWNSFDDSPKLPKKFKSFTGTQVLDSVNLKNGNSINLNFESDVKKGKFNIVVIDDKYNILKVIKANSNGKEKISVTQDGKYKVEMLGKNARGKAFAYWSK
ncbi:hypothetical protein [Clostridium sp. AWRP]|uniref:hypothetical protein n=1 Tax=Clostridium sp. AWRP TaxID=2212991 RepID=UPI000FD87C93|nr:hypothetical protein [Clostridium sp. AWRP]AZV58284.1 hypothetical protein DMR38_17760 [Clostridium sp. AWRP]